MAQNSDIEWTDATWNPVVGCRAYSAGCARCYAEAMSVRQAGMSKAKALKGRKPDRSANYLKVIQDGGWKGNVVTVPEALTDPFGWKKPRRVFVNSMSDLFYGDEADRLFCEAKGIPFEPVPFDFIDQVFATMALTPQHTYQILTKRTARMEEYFNAPIPLSTRADMVAGMHPTRIKGKLFAWGHPMKSWGRGAGTDPYDRRPFPGWPLKNVWMGTSVENQKTADERIPHLSKVPAAILFLSVEPLLGAITLPALSLIHWIIIGSESGPGRREMKQEWAESIVEQCRAAGVACFMKQMMVNGAISGDVSDFPASLRIRQYPSAVL